jgi:hypothetical protein
MPSSAHWQVYCLLELNMLCDCQVPSSSLRTCSAHQQVLSTRFAVGAVRCHLAACAPAPREEADRERGCDPLLLLLSISSAHQQVLSTRFAVGRVHINHASSPAGAKAGLEASAFSFGDDQVSGGRKGQSTRAVVQRNLARSRGAGCSLEGSGFI